MKMDFLCPIEGAMLCEIAGRVENGNFFTEVKVKAEPGREITVNGAPTAWKDGAYTCECVLNDRENLLTARDAESGEEVSITVYRLFETGKEYRVSVDDNIFFLQDIARTQPKSLFDNPYLAFYRNLSRKYGTKIHMNIFYCSPRDGGFALPEFPDKYRGEWEDNADWLRLSFHAFKEKPDWPYDRTDYRVAKEECEMVLNQIRRFAGEKSNSDYTTIHFCSGTQECVRAWRDLGYRALQAEPLNMTDGVCSDPIDYAMDHRDFYGGIMEYGYFYSKADDLVYTTADVVMNLPEHTPEHIPVHLSQIAKNYPKRGYKDLLIHEQYFYPWYERYLPDYGERIEAGIRWCVERGYKSVFRGDIVRKFVNPENAI